MSNKQLFEQLDTFANDNPMLNELKTLVAEFNIFEAIGAVRQELRHSDFLAFMLNPSEKHGLGDHFLKRFLVHVLSISDEPIISPNQIDMMDFSGALVEREKDYIDILIHDNHSGIVCLIENKIDSSEHDNQLQRYWDVITRRFPNARHIAVYLTPDKLDTSHKSYEIMGYAQVAEIMDALYLEVASDLSVDVDVAIRHYIMLLRRHIVSDSDIAQKCREIYWKNKDVIELIVQHGAGSHRIIMDYLISLFEPDKPFELLISGSGYVNFEPKDDWQRIDALKVGTEWQWANSNSLLMISFLNQDGHVSLVVTLGRTEPKDYHIRWAIYEVVEKNSDVFEKYEPFNEDKEFRIYRRSILTPQDFEIETIASMKAKIAQAWKEFVSNDYPQISGKFRQISFD